jgi:peroxiredoxin
MLDKVEEQRFGEPMPSFSLRSADGPTANLDLVIAGKKGAVVVIWSSTCSHCIRYDQYFNEFRHRYPELGLLIVGSRKQETFEGLQKVVRQRKLEFPIAWDPGGELANRWFTRQTPRAFLLDAQGALLYRGAIDNYRFPEDPAWVGYLEPAIRQFLDGKPIERQETVSFGCAVQSVYYDLPKAL